MAGVFFVTRLKDNAAFEVVEECEIPQNRNIRDDQFIRLTGAHAQANYPDLLRRIAAWDAENEREIVLLTNLMEFGATTIAAIYKERWQIELRPRHFNPETSTQITHRSPSKTCVFCRPRYRSVVYWTAVFAFRPAATALDDFTRRHLWAPPRVVSIMRSLSTSAAFAFSRVGIKRGGPPIGRRMRK